MARQARIGIIGSAGLIGTYHTNLLLDNEGPWQLTALCDVNAERLAAQCEQTALAGVATAEQLVGREDVDAVIIATPHPLHPVHAILAVEAGKDVLTEKPLASTPADARKMIKAINRCRRIGAIHYQQHTRPAWMKAKQMIDSGELGRLLCIRVTGSYYKSDFYYSLGGWRGLWLDEGGGVLINQAPHDIDMMCYLAGGSYPAELVGRWTNMYHRTSQVDDLAAAVGRFPNDVEFSLHVSVALHADPARFEIFGSAGAVTLVDGEFTRYIRYEQDLLDFCKDYAGPNPYQGPEVHEQALPELGEWDKLLLHRRFAEAVLTRKRKKVLVPAADGLWSMETINAVLLSGYLGKKVKLPVSQARYDKMLTDLIANAPDVPRGERNAQQGMQAKFRS